MKKDPPTTVSVSENVIKGCDNVGIGYIKDYSGM